MTFITFYCILYISSPTWECKEVAPMRATTILLAALIALVTISGCGMVEDRVRINPTVKSVSMDFGKEVLHIKVAPYDSNIYILGTAVDLPDGTTSAVSLNVSYWSGSAHQYNYGDAAFTFSPVDFKAVYRFKIRVEGPSIVADAIEETWEYQGGQCIKL